MKILDFIYYRVYKILQKTNANDIAEYVACIWLAALFAINIIFLINLFGFHPLKNMNSRVYSSLIIIPIFLFFYFYFIRKKRYLEISKDYSNESREKMLLGNVIFFIYLIITFGLNFI
jgi:hypothetical protein